MIRFILFSSVLLFSASPIVSATEPPSIESLKVDTSLLEHLVSLSLATGFESKMTPTGADFYSNAMMTLPNGTKTHKAVMILEGALPAPKNIKTIEDIINYNIDLIISTTKLNPNYPTENLVEEGLSAEIIDVNGTKVGLLHFQTPDMHMAKMTRIVLMKENRFYSFHLMSVDHESHNKRQLNLWAFVIAAVNSGKL